VDLTVIGKMLGSACGEVREGQEGDAISGVAAETIVPAFVALPGSTDEAAAVMRVAAEHELAVVARGAGSRLGWGVPPSRADLVVDMSLMSAVVEHASGDLVAKVQAGARIGDVGAVLGAAGQEIALDVPLRATVGGVVGSGLAGPRRLRYGTPRDLLIGITIVRADGIVAKSGGKVVKNVAGYDLGKLMAGSAGTLALITEATFRLHPLAAARAYVTADYAGVSAACDAVAAAANSPLTSAAVELQRAAPGGPLRVGVLLEGSPDGVDVRAMRMAALLGTADVAQTPPAWWPGAPDARDGEALVRVSFWVSKLGTVLDTIDATAAAAGVCPVIAGSAGAGVLYVRLGPDVSAETPDEHTLRAARFTAALRRALAGQRGSVVVLAAPASVREELAGDGGMHGTVPSLALMRAVKEQFDPGHRMSPGRFPEGI